MTESSERFTLWSKRVMTSLQCYTVNEIVLPVDPMPRDVSRVSLLCYEILWYQNKASGHRYDFRSRQKYKCNMSYVFRFIYNIFLWNCFQLNLHILWFFNCKCSCNIAFNLTHTFCNYKCSCSCEIAFN